MGGAPVVTGSETVMDPQGWADLLDSSAAKAQATLLDAWQRALPLIDETLQGDRLVDVVDVKATKTVVITARHVALLRVHRMPLLSMPHQRITKHHMFPSQHSVVQRPMASLRIASSGWSPLLGCRVLMGTLTTSSARSTWWINSSWGRRRCRSRVVDCCDAAARLCMSSCCRR